MLKARLAPADSDSDSRLGTDGNQPGLERREGAADDAALLIARETFETFAGQVELLVAEAVPGPNLRGRSH